MSGNLGPKMDSKISLSTMVLIVVIAGAVGYYLLRGASRGSVAYRASFEFAKHHPRIVTDLGKNISSDGAVKESNTVVGPRGTTTLSFSLRGDRGEGLVDVVSTNDAHGWQIRSGMWHFRDRHIPLRPEDSALIYRREILPHKGNNSHQGADRWRDQIN